MNAIGSASLCSPSAMNVPPSSRRAARASQPADFSASTAFSLERSGVALAGLDRLARGLPRFHAAGVDEDQLARELEVEQVLRRELRVGAVAAIAVHHDLLRAR